MYKKYGAELPKGRLFGLFLTLLFTARFIIEYFKDVQVPFERGMTLDMGQWLSIPAVLAGLAILWWSWWNGKKETNEPIEKQNDI